MNSFQKTMMQWNALHPYNAVHVVEVAGTLDVRRLKTKLLAVLWRRGVASVEVKDEGFVYQPDRLLERMELVEIDGEWDPRTALVLEMERQLNRPFPCGKAFRPFRLLVMSAGETFYVGLVYFHAVADAESIVGMLQELVAEYLGVETTPGSPAPNLYPETRTDLLKRHPGVLWRKLLALPGQLRQLGRSHRPPVGSADPAANGFTLFTIGPEEWGALRAAAKAWSVTVNDVFLAVLLLALSPCAAGRVTARKRRKLTVGCVVNVRREMAAESRESFGLFLGSFTVTHAVPEGITLRTLAGEIQQQTAAIKRDQMYLATPLELALGRFACRFFSAERRKKLYAKHYPLWGGITNLNLNTLWQAGSPAPLDYWRGVSTGPITPLVLSVTTAGERVNVGVSYRTSVFSREEMGALQSRFRKHLEETHSVA